MTFTNAKKLLLPTLVAALAVAVLAAMPAGAIVPPRDCGFVTVKHHKYNVKSDQIVCPKARKYATTYLKTRHKPRYFKCERPKGSSLAFRCVASHYDPPRTFFAIKR